ncbi:MAG: L,D-transpeptidase [Pseudomonadota bacterium]
MPRVGLKFLAAFVLMAGVSACVPDPALVNAGLVKAPPAAVAAPDAAYAATKDANFDIPALPVDQIPETYRRQAVTFVSDQPPGTIIIDPGKKLLHFVTGKNTAIRYGIGVGKAGFEWSGEAIVNEKKPWPTWTPPKEMIERKPELAKFAGGQPGGLTNPLGARALYLTTNGVDYGYRIHGTPEWRTIGTNASSGCIRMINQDVMDLYSRVQGGEKVVVLTASGQMPKGLTLPPHTPKKKDAPKASPAPAAADVVTPVVAPAVPKLQTLPQPAFTTGAAVAPAASPAVAAPAATSAPAAAAPAAPAAACSVALVNGVCPQN